MGKWGRGEGRKEAEREGKRQKEEIKEGVNRKGKLSEWGRGEGEQRESHRIATTLTATDSKFPPRTERFSPFPPTPQVIAPDTSSEHFLYRSGV